MNAADILLAIREGRAEWHWATVKSGPVTLSVFADALKVDGVRVSVSARTAQTVADNLGCILTTPLIEDLIYQQAEVRIPPFPGEVTERLAKDHSADIDKMLARGAKSIQPETLIATVGKSWVLSNKATADRAVNYGWHCERWRGGTVPVSRAFHATDVQVIQPPSTAHNLEHVDYSQTLRLVDAHCQFDGPNFFLGVKTPVASILQDPDGWVYISHEGPLKHIRQPGVAVTMEAAAQSEMPAMDPSMMGMGEWCALWCEDQASKSPVPSPSMIAEWLAPCVRGSRGDAIRLGLTSGNHCAAAQCAAMKAAQSSWNWEPHDYRASAKELMQDAMDRGSWRPASRWHSGEWEPRRGDLAIYDRSIPSRPETAWWGHVDRVIAVRGPGEVETLGANEGPRGEWRREVLKSLHPRLLGFVEYPRRDKGAEKPPGTVGVYRSAHDAFALSLARTVEECLAEQREHGWTPRD